ncbi:hypothetical protein [Butyrivibrio sp. NC3005]|uniref:hypothetical protein n=1 Tax=Butyrivibrio sp. NC3005 TaxID=1280685 RepID=UPI0004795D8F|nr:hypothetical protein [Butyrivibrio sp. NC3005]
MKKKAIIWIKILSAFCLGFITRSKMRSFKINNNTQDSNKYWQSYLMMNEWMQLKQKGRNLSEYFKEHGYKNIAIYGMHHTGITLQNELDGTGINVVYGIDANAETIYSDIEVKKPEGRLPEVDVIVVTPIYYFTDIEEKLVSLVSCPIISLDDVVFGM